MDRELGGVMRARLDNHLTQHLDRRPFDWMYSVRRVNSKIAALDTTQGELGIARARSMGEDDDGGSEI